jgi:hypothetical protein
MERKSKLILGKLHNYQSYTQTHITYIHTVTDHFWYSFFLFIKFTGISYRWFMAMRYKFNLSTYVQELLVIGRRGCTGRDLNEEC